MRALSVLGSTGSIGRQTLEVAAACGHRVLALTAHHNIALLEQQARTVSSRSSQRQRTQPAAAALAMRLSDTDIRVLAGEEGVLAAARLPQAGHGRSTALVGIAGPGAPPWPPSTAASASPWPTRRPWCAPASWSWPGPGRRGRRSSRWTRSTRLFFRASRAAPDQGAPAHAPHRLRRTLLRLEPGGSWRGLPRPGPCSTPTGPWGPRSPLTRPP